MTADWPSREQEKSQLCTKAFLVPPTMSPVIHKSIQNFFHHGPSYAQKNSKFLPPWPSFWRGEEIFVPLISALWLQGQLPSSAPVPFQHLSHLPGSSAKGRASRSVPGELQSFMVGWGKRDLIFRIGSWSDWSLSSLEHIPLSSSPESSQELEKYSGQEATVPLLCFLLPAQTARPLGSCI